jgi:hypothetical protein
MIPNAFIASNGLIVNGDADITGDLTVHGQQHCLENNIDSRFGLQQQYDKY